jgi:topoisomerase-4 subunit A
VCHIDTREAFSFIVKFKPKPRLKVLQAEYHAGDYEEKGLKAQGVRLASKEADKVLLEKKPEQPELL